MQRGRTKERTVLRSERDQTPMGDDGRWALHGVCTTCRRGYKGLQMCGQCRQPLLWVSYDFRVPSRKTRFGKREWTYINSKRKGPIERPTFNGFERRFYESIKDM